MLRNPRRKPIASDAARRLIPPLPHPSWTHGPGHNHLPCDAITADEFWRCLEV